MNLRQMEVFHAVMTCGTVTAAARALAISQPSVTGVLRHLEDKLRFKLFDRVKGRLLPTSEAQILFAQIEHVFERVEGVKRTIQDLREVRSGTLSVVSIPAVGTTLLPAAIGGFVATHPDVAIRYRMLPRHAVLDAVQSRSTDLGLGFLTSSLPRVAHREIARRDLICIMPKSHPLRRLAQVSAADIAPFPLIAYTNTQGLAPLINAIFAEARIAARPGLEVDLILNAWALVNAGAGVALVDPFSGIGGTFPHVIARPFVPATPLALEVIHAEDRPLSRVGEAFLAHVRDFVARSAPLAPVERPPRLGAAVAGPGAPAAGRGRAMHGHRR